jgi:antitoxin MazE
MKIEFVKWGNSLALRVPKAFAQEVGAAEGKRADLTVDNGALVVRVVSAKKRRRYVLENLVNAITEENRRPEVGWGPPRGNEIW